VRRVNGNKVWRCNVRNKSVWCKAIVSQKGSLFTQGSQPHTHPAQLGAAVATKVAAAAKKIAATEIFTSAAEIVNKVICYYYFLINYFNWELIINLGSSKFKLHFR
jgi:hypothetical protein